MVALPQGNDQPGVAARVAACGAGVVLTRRELTVAKVRSAVRAVLEDRRYGDAAKRLQAEMKTTDGLACAADVIEEALGIALCDHSRA